VLITGGDDVVSPSQSILFPFPSPVLTFSQQYRTENAISKPFNCSGLVPVWLMDGSFIKKEREKNHLADFFVDVHFFHFSSNDFRSSPHLTNVRLTH
jgi:hypothetical protein